jgi:membrane-associated phospholipid phosphatase
MIRAWRIPLFLMSVLLAITLGGGLDQQVARSMERIDPLTTRAFAIVTWFGQGGVLLYPLGAIVIVAWALKRWLPGRLGALDRLMCSAAAVFLPVAAAGLVNDGLKILFGRARPRFWLAGDMSGFDFVRYGFKYASFPSGHTATSVAAAIAFGVLYPRWRIVFCALALLIATSRVALDFHYPSDVIAGAGVGAATALAVLGRLETAGILRRARRSKAQPA